MNRESYRDYGPYFRKNAVGKNVITEDEAREIFKAHGCEMIGEFKGITFPVKYLYEGNEYKVRIAHWRDYFVRPHKGIYSSDLDRIYEDYRRNPKNDQYCRDV